VHLIEEAQQDISGAQPSEVLWTPGQSSQAHLLLPSAKEKFLTLPKARAIEAIYDYMIGSSMVDWSRIPCFDHDRIQQGICICTP